ncbi:carbon-phosphorus lyase complex subunit PhnI [Paraburkholderia aspalathi]|uniref:Alpha-D-ribose 1-methylphosphonate 5-triphosphate synthase subunit PhnI n=1 Tax=Paraburkholderia aspalathi TaxID=1324617 RepID=A0A1I7B8L5_9BURK|nr:carbon-phosphorus lyase complex subunit PhnI [Paraburkholderia aspalathi]SFT83478.1 alpha-D-ribose 1-methylphosphonate 5-triphosphate synthase subunit PhnI [Paraburkholderia aspalathi]
MYVAVKGGERAIEASWRLLEDARRGDRAIPELSISQIRQQMRLGVARVMAEGSLYDEELAALAIKQAAGDLIEAIFLLRAYRTTLQRFGYTVSIDTEQMEVQRRVSASFKDVPGGQLLGATHDYTQRLLDFKLLVEQSDAPHEPHTAQTKATKAFDTDTKAANSEGQERTITPRVFRLIEAEGVIEQEQPTADGSEPIDLAVEPLLMPATRAVRLQNLARADEGFLLSLAYSTQRGYGDGHPYVGEIRFGKVPVEMNVPELDFPIELGEIDMTECQTITQFAGDARTPPAFTQGYGLAFGHSERKVLAMSLVDRALRAEELGEAVTAPAQDLEFVLYHSDNVESSGYVQHMKLPHYVDVQSELNTLRRLRAEHPALRTASEKEQAE